MGDTTFEKQLKILEKTMSKEYELTNGIKREGDIIIIPQDMSYKDAARMLVDYEKRMEEPQRTAVKFETHPDDALVAFYRSVNDNFGKLIGATTQTFFGTIPAKTKAVPIGFDQTLVVPIDRAEIPGINLVMQIQPYYDESNENGGWLDVQFGYTRKYEPLVKKIEEKAREYLRDNSIFKGKAIDSDWKFLDSEKFDITRVVYSEKEFKALNANVFTPIVETEEWLSSGASLKRGVLLHGPYGTGKTLTALYVARLAYDHGWTFVLVHKPDNLKKILRFAKRMQPCVIFFEDIDARTSGERNDALNDILNTVDDILSKNSKVMVLYTTNHLEKINDAMKRPGRLDSFIKMGELDPDSTVRLIEARARNKAGKSTLAGPLDPQRVWEAAHDYSPAFVVESVTKATAYAIARGAHKNGGLKITEQDIIDACIELRPQFDDMNKGVQKDTPLVDQALNELVEKKVVAAVEKATETLYTLVDNIDDTVRDIHDHVS